MKRQMKERGESACAFPAYLFRRREKKGKKGGGNTKNLQPNFPLMDVEIGEGGGEGEGERGRLQSAEKWQKKGRKKRKGSTPLHELYFIITPNGGFRERKGKISSNRPRPGPTSRG